MIKVVFLARLRDEVGRSELTISCEQAGRDVQSLRQHLISEGLTALADDSVRVALNQRFCTDLSQVVKEGDEVAFMPPVTGG